VLLVYIVYVGQSTELHCSLTNPLWFTTTVTHDDNHIHKEKYFSSETSPVLNYLYQIFCLNTAATFTVQATDYRLDLYFTMQR